MTDSLFEAVALCSKELMKYSLSAEEFAVLAQKNGMTDSEILAVSKTFEYLRDKKKRESRGVPAAYQPPAAEGAEDL